MNAVVRTLDASSHLVAVGGADVHGPASMAALADKIDELVGQCDVEAVSASGALSVTTRSTELSVDGTKAYTLAAPTVAGQRKRVACVAAINTPAGTLTVSSPDDTVGFVCASKFFFDGVGQVLELEATSALKWRAVRIERAGYKTLVLATTVTTDICNMSHVLVSTDGTKSSTGSKALPNGSAVGEVCFVGCVSATNTPHGTLGGTFVLPNGTAGTTLVDWTAATQQASLRWNGQAWQLYGAVGGIVAA